MKSIGAVLFFFWMATVWLLGAAIYFGTLYIAYLTGFIPTLLTLFFPFIGQLVWIWVLWDVTGTFFHPLTVACLTWVGMTATGAIAMLYLDRK